MKPYEPVIGRKYTITHSDETAELFVAGDGIAIPQLAYNTQLGHLLAVWSTRYVGTSPASPLPFICYHLLPKTYHLSASYLHYCNYQYNLIIR